ncbi:MAG: tRNA (guanosine(18)-2'-O)-methyltransferase TrmH [Gammaproteobacteria bacterium]
MTPERFRKNKAVLSRRQPDLTVIAENVHKSHNIAALVRTCDAVGVYRLNAVSPEGDFPRHHITTAGTGKWVKRQLHPDIESAIEANRKRGFRILAAHLSANAQDYREIDYTQPVAIVLGSELPGVSEKTAALADEHVIIPMRGMVDSLNVSVANALLLYEAARQREQAGLYDNCRLEQDEFNTTLFEWCYPDVAQKCRDHGVSYPKLDEDGLFSDNPLPGQSQASGL